MNEFNNGAKYVRNSILAMLIGLQNKIGYSSPDDSLLVAYQQIYNLIKDNCGDMFEDFKG